MYSEYGITFDNGVSWSFNNGTARNVVIFGVDRSSPSHVDNHKNDFLILGLGPTYGINLVLILLNQTQNFAWVYIIMMIISYLFFNGKKK